MSLLSQRTEDGRVKMHERRIENDVEQLLNLSSSPVLKQAVKDELRLNLRHYQAAVSRATLEQLANDIEVGMPGIMGQAAAAWVRSKMIDPTE